MQRARRVRSTAVIVAIALLSLDIVGDSGGPTPARAALAAKPLPRVPDRPKGGAPLPPGSVSVTPKILDAPPTQAPGKKGDLRSKALKRALTLANPPAAPKAISPLPAAVAAAEASLRDLSESGRIPKKVDPASALGKVLAKPLPADSEPLSSLPIADKNDASDARVVAQPALLPAPLVGLPRKGMSARGSEIQLTQRGAASVQTAAFVAGDSARYSVGQLTLKPTYRSYGQQVVTVINDSSTSWGPNEIVLSYHIYRGDGSHYSHTPAFTYIATGVPAGTSTTINAAIAPLPAGTFQIAWDVFRSSTGRDWFSNHGVPASQVQQFTIPHYAPTAELIFPYNGGSVDTLRPRLEVWLYHDNTQPVTLSIEYCRQGTNSCWTSGSLAAPGDTDFESRVLYTVPADIMYWNATYEWWATVSDGVTTPSTTPRASFTPVVPQPEHSVLGTDPSDVDANGVNLFTGNFTKVVTDLTLPGPHGPLEAKRTYNSTDRRVGAFGLGWSSVIDSAWSESADGIVTIRFPDGKMLAYGRNPDNRYAAGYGQSGNFTLFHNTRTIRVGDQNYSYDLTTGRIKSISSRTTRSYVIFNSDANGHVTEIHDTSSSRKLYLQWNGIYVGSVATAPVIDQTALWARYSYSTASTNVQHELHTVSYRDFGSIYYSSNVMASGLRGLGRIDTGDGKKRTDITYSGLRVSRIDYAGGTWRYSYQDVDDNFNETQITKVVDPRGTQAQYGFGATGDLRRRWTVDDAASNTNRRIWSYDFVGRLQAVIDENWNVTEYYWDSLSGQIQDTNRLRDANTLTNTHTRYFYDVNNAGDPRNGLVEATKDANGNWTYYTYDSNALLIRKVGPPTPASPAGAATSYTYTCGPNGRPVVNDPGAPGNAAQPCYLLSTITDPNGRVTAYEYDRFGNQTRHTTPAGSVTDVWYDAFGRPSRQVARTRLDPAGAETQFTHDAQGLLLTKTGPAVTNPVTGVVHQERITNTHSHGALTRTTQSDTTPVSAGGDPPRTIEYQLDDALRPVVVVESGVVVAVITYDAAGNVIESLDPKWTRYRFAYDALGRLTQTTLVDFVDDPVAGSPPRNVVLARRTFDPSGRVTSAVDAMNHQVDYTYTWDDLLLTETLRNFNGGDGTPTHDVLLHRYSYDRLGNVTSDTQGTGSAARTIATTFTAANHRASMTLDPGGLNRLTTYVSDPTGMLLSTSLSDGERTETDTNVYGADGQLARTAELNSSGPIVEAFDRDSDGRVVRSTSARGVASLTALPDPAFATNHTYDAAGRLSTSIGPAISAEDGTGGPAVTAWPRVRHGYNTFGERTELVDQRGGVTRKRYDNRGRVVQVNHPTAQVEANYSEVVLADQPVSYWSLNEVGRDATDLVAGRKATFVQPVNVPTTVGAALTDAENHGLDFAGRPNEASTPNDVSVTRSALTLEAWFTAGTAANHNVMLRQLYDFGLELWQPPGTEPRLFASVGQTTSATTGPLPALKTGWHHVAVTYDAYTLRIYVDGIEVVTKAGGTTNLLNQHPLRIAGDNNGWERRWANKLDNVAVYSRVLTQTQIARHVQAAKLLTTHSISPRETWRYDETGNVVAHTNRRGVTESTIWDKRNRPVRVTLPPAGHGVQSGVIRRTFDDNDNVVSEIDPAGGQVLVTYNGMDGVASIDQVDRWPTLRHNITRFAYNDFGEPLTTSTDHASTNKTYNKAGELISYTESGRGTTRMTYDLAGRLTQTTDPLGRSTRATYDLSGRRTALEKLTAVGNVVAQIAYSYDANDNVTAVTDANGHTTRATYDSADRLASRTEPAVASADGVPQGVPSVSMGYDVAGSPTKLIVGGKQRALQTYNAWGLPVTRVEPTTTAQPNAVDRTWTSLYDGAGSPVVEGAPGDVAISTTYDALGRASRQVGEGADRYATKSFEYDLNGRLSKTGSPYGDLEFWWNDRGQLIDSWQPSQVGDGVDNWHYDYDTSGRLTRSSGHTGSVSYGYSGVADVSTMTDSLTGAARTYTYDVAGQRTREQLSINGTPGMRRSWTYDAIGRPATDVVTSSPGQTTASVAYAWDQVGNLVGRTTGGGLAGASVNEYTYDAANRLVRHENKTAARGEDYRWDTSGNRTLLTTWTGTSSARSVTATTSATYDERDRLLSTSSATGSTTYAWSPRGTLSSVTTTPAGGTANTVVSKFDAFNRLTQRGTNIAYSYDDLDRLVDVCCQTGYGVLEYAGLDREPTTNGNWTVLRDLQRNPIASRADVLSSATVVMQDVHGDVLGSLNPTTASVTGSRSYSPFGVVQNSFGAQSPLGYQGSLTDGTSGQVHADARWYDPSTGIFVSRDTAPGPSSSAAGSHLYGYGNANPTTYSDPTGHFGNPVDILRGTLELGRSAAGLLGSGASTVARSGAGIIATGATAAVAIAQPVATGFVCAAVCAAAAVVGTAVLIGGVAYVYTHRNDGKVVAVKLDIDPDTGEPLRSYRSPSVVAVKKHSYTQRWTVVDKYRTGDYMATRTTKYVRIVRYAVTTYSNGAWSRQDAGSSTGWSSVTTFAAVPKPAVPARPSPKPGAPKPGNQPRKPTPPRLPGLPPPVTESAGDPVPDGGEAPSEDGLPGGTMPEPDVAPPARPMIDLSNVVTLSTPDAAAPTSRGATTASGGCGAGGPVTTCVTQESAPLPQLASAGGAARSGGGDCVGSGIVYLRTDANGTKPYVGQAKSPERFDERQKEHARAHMGSDFEFEQIGSAEPGAALDWLEELKIRELGGPTSMKNPNGILANRRHQMVDSRFAKGGC